MVKKLKKKNEIQNKKNWNFFSDIGSRSSVDSMPCVEDPVSTVTQILTILFHNDFF